MLGSSGQVVGQHIRSNGNEHQKQSDPELPVVMGASPVGDTGAGAVVAGGAIVAVLVLDFVHGAILPEMTRHAPRDVQGEAINQMGSQEVRMPAPGPAWAAVQAAGPEP